MYITLQDLVNRQIEIGNIIADSEALKNLIVEDENSIQKKEMREGVEYYKVENSFVNSKNFQEFFVGKVKHYDYNKSNLKLANGFHRILVDQKTGYIVGNPITITSEEEGLQNILEENLGDWINDTFTEWVKGASNKGVEVLHPFIDEDGELDYTIIDAIECIPIYDSQYEKRLEAVIRYYKIEQLRDKQKEEVYRVEHWDKDKVTFYLEIKNGEKSIFVLDDSEPINPRPHWLEYKEVDENGNPKDGQGRSWGRVPFIFLKNNEEKTSDLKVIKSLIDSYDLILSHLSNELVDFQEVVRIVRGYPNTDASEAYKNLRTFKMLLLDGMDNSGVDSDRTEIPIQAKEAFFNRMEKNIYTFGGGVDMSTDKFGNSPSGIALKFMYALLDLKANALIRKMKRALKDFIWFVVEFINMDSNANYDYNKIDFTFNLSTIMNEQEIIQNLAVSKGMISDETIIKNHPYVDDSEEELKKLESQQDVDLERFQQMNPVDENV